MHVNIRSLLPKFAKAVSKTHFTNPDVLADSANPDVLAVSESWLRKTTRNSEIFIPNYNIFRQDRTTKGGGVAIYCIRNGSAVKRPPLITVKRSLKHFSEQAFLIDLARVSWKDIDLIPSVENAWVFFFKCLPHHRKYI